MHMTLGLSSEWNGGSALDLKIILSTQYSNSLNIFLEILYDFCLLAYFINNNMI